MTSAPVSTATSQTGQLLLACVGENGSASHPWLQHGELLRGEHSARSLSDLIHHLRVLHGRYPGVIDNASSRAAEPASRSWLAQATYVFAGERAYLARLASAAGPVPSTPGAATDPMMRAQLRAMEMLAKSERHGCALGTAMAVVLDWVHVRAVLDCAAIRFGVEPPPFPLGDRASIAVLAQDFSQSGPLERALLFGARQITSQHRALWDLLAARHHARLAAECLPATPDIQAVHTG